MAGTGERLRKRIFLNLDGTGQAEYTLKGLVTADGKKTSSPVSNIARIGRATLIDDEAGNFQQIVYYQAGIGASAELSMFTAKSQGAWGTGLVQNVREAYGFLCNNYDYGDEIYITGFSRGAFTARSVAGLIGKVGILTKKGLDLFYEAFDYYEFPKNWEGKASPVSEDAKTTRVFAPGSNKTKRIKVRAVGVFDTVGALSGDYSFHDVTLGDHIENAFHIMSLNEKRGYYNPTLWESPNKERTYETFEQCWMAGDHSNIGGSWPDQQLADISLAWMMSRFEVLGVKFNQSYLYDEFLKNKKYVEKDSGFAKGEPTNPRQWGEGQSKEVDATLYGGTVVRTPMMYKQPKLIHGWTTNYMGDGDAFLSNANETVHPAVRYRHFCTNQGKLGADDARAYNPGSLDGWTWPCAQPDGRIGATQTASSSGALVYSKIRDGANITMKESVMGKHEKILLALYNQDPLFKSRNRNVWKEVLGGDGPPQAIKDAVSQVTKSTG